MKSVGIIRQIDKLGRVVIPRELRSRLDIGDGDFAEIAVDGEKIILSKYFAGCMFCNEQGTPFSNTDKPICKKCADAVKNSAQ